MSITKGHTRLIPCSLHSDCKNVQKSALKSVNVQRTGKSIVQMFAFSFFEGSHICRFLPILRPSTVPRSHFRYPKTKAFVLIIRYLYLQIVTSASEITSVSHWFIISCNFLKKKIEIYSSIFTSLTIKTLRFSFQVIRVFLFSIFYRISTVKSTIYVSKTH